MKNILELLICPLCGSHMDRTERSIVCPAGHTFDIAKSGYVNLLPPGKGKNARTGDEREMVRARSEFLECGYYDRITEVMAQVTAKYLQKNEYTVCDMGCGEGYHTCRFVRRLSDETGARVTAVGFDASKYAAEKGSKRAVSGSLMPRDGVGAPHDGNSAYFFPANIFHLPVREHSVNVVLSMFAPVAGEEAKRILTDDGILVVVSSGREHLLEMRQRIYDDVRLSDDLPSTPDGFYDIARLNDRLSVNIRTAEELLSLFTMTPFYYKTTERGRERLSSSDMPFSLTVDVNYSIFGVL